MPLRKGQKINRPPLPIAVRFATKYVIDADSECWLWTGYVAKNGYGYFSAPGGAGSKREPLLAHRVSYELHVGPIPSGLTIDHLCRVRSCVNPAHLEVTTQRENNLRGCSVTALNAVKTHCKHGHAFTRENTYWNPDGTGRRCRECMRQNTRDWRARRRAA